MKTRRILAASTAALLAFGTTAAYVASADDASSTTSAATTGMSANKIVIADSKTTKIYTAHIEGKVSGSDLNDLLAPSFAAGTATQIGPLPANTGITDPQVVSGIAVETQKWDAAANSGAGGAVTDKTGATDNSLNPYNNLSLGWWLNKNVGDSFKMSNAKIDVKVAGKAQKYTMDKSDPTSIVLTPDGSPVDVTTSTVSKSFGTINKKDINSMTMMNPGTTFLATLPTPTGATPAAVTTEPQAFQPAFTGLSETNQLTSIDTSKSEIVYSFDVEMNEDDWKLFFTANGIKWDNTSGTAGATTGWTDLTFEQLLAENGTKIAQGLCGIEGNSWKYDRKTKAGALLATTASVKASNIKDESKTEDVLMPLNGRVYVNVGTNANLQQLKAINEGGYLTFELNKAIDPAKFVGIATVMYLGDAGVIELPLSGTYTTSEDNTTFKFKLPAGLTYNEQLNSYNAFVAEYNISIKKFAANDNRDPADETSYKVKTITFESASSAASNNSGSTGTSGSGNGGNGGSGTTNPDTGIALAIAPVVLAAGAVAVVALKKKH